VEICSSSDGKFELKGAICPLASMLVRHIDVGPCTVVRHQGIHIPPGDPENTNFRSGATA
jgi:hypothetical protein